MPAVSMWSRVNISGRCRFQRLGFHTNWFNTEKTDEAMVAVLS